MDFFRKEYFVLRYGYALLIIRLVKIGKNKCLNYAFVDTIFSKLNLPTNYYFQKEVCVKFCVCGICKRI